jgi:hypothetical protein
MIIGLCSLLEKRFYHNSVRLFLIPLTRYRMDGLHFMLHATGDILVWVDILLKEGANINAVNNVIDTMGFPFDK